MTRGVSFEIPNNYGNYLKDILKPIDIAAFDWQIGSGESYAVIWGRVDKELFPSEKNIIEGSELKNRIETNKHYLVSVDLQAYRHNEVGRVETFEDFIVSNCQLVLLVVDTIYVTIYCKNQDTIQLLINNARACGFEDIEYITDENDGRTRLSVW